MGGKEQMKVSMSMHVGLVTSTIINFLQAVVIAPKK